MKIDKIVYYEYLIMRKNASTSRSENPFENPHHPRQDGRSSGKPFFIFMGFAAENHPLKNRRNSLPVGRSRAREGGNTQKREHDGQEIARFTSVEKLPNPHQRRGPWGFRRPASSSAAQTPRWSTAPRPSGRRYGSTQTRNRRGAAGPGHAGTASPSHRCRSACSRPA